jgi:hypothetical protein
MKNFFKMDENKLISIFFTFCLIAMILCTILLLNISHETEIGNAKTKQLEIDKKDKIIDCIKHQLYCYNINRQLGENVKVKICNPVDFCENL